MVRRSVFLRPEGVLMPSRTSAVVFVGFVALFFVPVAPADAPREKPDAGEIAHWIERLGDDDFNKREEASRKLEEAGEAALPALREAAEKHADAEVRSRAAKIAAAIGKALWPELRSINGGTPGYWWNRVAFTPDGKQALVAGGGLFLYDLETGKQIYRGAMEDAIRPPRPVSVEGRRPVSYRPSERPGRPPRRRADWQGGPNVRRSRCRRVGHGALARRRLGRFRRRRQDPAHLGREDRQGTAPLRRRHGQPAMPGVRRQGEPFRVGARPARAARSSSACGTRKLARRYASFKGHDAAVTAVAFLSDGKYLLSASMDGTIRLWEVETGKEVRRMKHDGAVYDVAASPDGTRALSAGYEDRTVRPVGPGDREGVPPIHRTRGARAGRGDLPGRQARPVLRRQPDADPVAIGQVSHNAIIGRAVGINASFLSDKSRNHNTIIGAWPE